MPSYRGRNRPAFLLRPADLLSSALLTPSQIRQENQAFYVNGAVLNSVIYQAASNQRVSDTYITINPKDPYGTLSFLGL